VCVCVCADSCSLTEIEVGEAVVLADPTLFVKVGVLCVCMLVLCVCKLMLCDKNRGW